MSTIKFETLQHVKDEKRLKRYNRMVSKFKSLYNKDPSFICRAPGRVNLIGEHIDYCGYSVLPMAITQDVSIAVGMHNKDKINIANVNDCYGKAEVELSSYQVDSSNLSWYHYVLCGHKGICCEEKVLSSVGMELLVDGNVPKAAGMSSSSALVCASGLVTAVANQATTDRFRLAEVCARCERFIGTQGGGMDQSISFLAEQGKAKIIGFNPLTVEDVQLPNKAVFVVANSRVPSEKAMTSHFNVRVAECKIASQVLAKLLNVDLKKAKKFFDLQQALDENFEQMLEHCEKLLHKDIYLRDEICKILEIEDHTFQELYLSKNTTEVSEFKLYERAKHVFGEASRVMKFRSICDLHSSNKPAEKEGDGGDEEESSDILVQLGQLMNDSHQSCSDLYECSCTELDRLTNKCREAGALGSRMTGAGWGGCTVSLVRDCQLDDFMKKITQEIYPDVSDEDSLSQMLFSTAPSQGAAVYQLA